MEINALSVACTLHGPKIPRRAINSNYHRKARMKMKRVQHMFHVLNSQQNMMFLKYVMHSETSFLQAWQQLWQVFTSQKTLG